jgi:hypothetical protein
MAEMRTAFEKEEDLFKVFRLMDECFSDGCFALKDLIKDEQRKILDCLTAATSTNLDSQVRRIFARVAPLVESMLNLGMTPPPRFTIVADDYLHSQLLDEFMRHPVRFDNVRSLLETAKIRNIKWRKNALEPEIRAIIKSLVCDTQRAPADITMWRNLSAAVSAAKFLPFIVDFYEAQNYCYELLRDQYPEIKAAADKGNADAASLKKELRMLGALLSIKYPG